MTKKTRQTDADQTAGTEDDAYKQKVPNGSGGKEDGAPEEHEPLKEVPLPKTSPSVWKAIMATFGGYYVLGGIFKLVYDIISFINPQILK